MQNILISKGSYQGLWMENWFLKTNFLVAQFLRKPECSGQAFEWRLPEFLLATNGRCLQKRFDNCGNSWYVSLIRVTTCPINSSDCCLRTADYSHSTRIRLDSTVSQKVISLYRENVVTRMRVSRSIIPWLFRRRKYI